MLWDSCVSCAFHSDILPQLACSTQFPFKGKAMCLVLYGTVGYVNRRIPLLSVRPFGFYIVNPIPAVFVSLGYWVLGLRTGVEYPGLHPPMHQTIYDQQGNSCLMTTMTFTLPYVHF